MKHTKTRCEILSSCLHQREISSERLFGARVDNFTHLAKLVLDLLRHSSLLDLIDGSE